MKDEDEREEGSLGLFIASAEGISTARGLLLEGGLSSSLGFALVALVAESSTGVDCRCIWKHSNTRLGIVAV